MRKLMFLTLLTALVSVGITVAEDYKVVVPQLSPSATDAFKNLITAVLEETGNSGTVQVLPPARCIYLVEAKQADILSATTAIADPKKQNELNFDYSTVETNKVAIVLYYNKAKPINVQDLKAGKLKGLKLETNNSHLDHFDFPISGSSNIDASLQKVDGGLIDGFLYTQNTTDAALKRLGLKNVGRAYFTTLSGRFVLQKGMRGGGLDKILTDGIAKLKANGRFNTVMAAVLVGQDYEDWQP